MTLGSGGRISWASWRPLGPEDEPAIKPRILIFHTMGGNLRVVDRMFRVGGYDGTEATFGVGGKWSPEDRDGELFQWQVTGRQADAQFAGNDYADSVETADGGNPHNPWTTPQLTTLIRLGVDWCRGTGNPARLVNSTSDHGFGYHEQFLVWNTDHHGCPGQVREGQLRTIVIPKVRSELKGHPHYVKIDPTKDDHIRVDGIWSHETVVALQIALGFRGHDVDGVFGPQTRKRLQKKVGAAQDGHIGSATIKHWKFHLKGKGFWHWSNNTIDGHWDKALTFQTQKALNAHKF